MKNVDKLLRYLIETSLDEFSFFDSPDEDKPGNYQFLTFDANTEYPKIQGNTHGLSSHTVKHLDEFLPDIVTNAINQAISLYAPSTDVILKSAKNNAEIARGAEAIRSVQRGAILNTFDMINDKVKNGLELNPIESQVLSVLENLNSTYEGLIQQYMDQAVDADEISDENRLRELINSGAIVKFNGSYKGYPKTYYINFSNSGLIAAEDDEISTLFRIDKTGAALPKIRKYLSRDTHVDSAAFRNALGIPSETPAPAPNRENPAEATPTKTEIVTEHVFNSKRWQKLAKIIKD